MNGNCQPSTVVVSGGSRGLGLEIVEHLLQRGANVATFARSDTEATRELAVKHGERFHFEALDARDLERTASFVDAACERFSPPYGLVNNAALGQDHLLAQTPPEAVARLLAVNLNAPILLTRSMIRKMLLSGTGGRIVNISSICGLKGYPGLVVYSATKGAMDAFTRSLAREVGARNILVNSIAPGFFESEMSSVLSVEQLDTIRRRTPTGRLIESKEILPVLDMLLFSNTNLTGQTIVVDGGITC